MLHEATEGRGADVVLDVMGANATAADPGRAAGSRIIRRSTRPARRTGVLGASSMIGVKYLARNLVVLAVNGRLVIIGLQGGARAEINLGQLLAKRAAVIATTLRSRPADEKAAIVAAVREHVWPLIAAGQVRPVIHATYPMSQVSAAHAVVEASSHVGKVLLTVGS